MARILSLLLCLTLALGASESLQSRLFPVDFQDGSYHLNENFPGALAFSLQANGGALATEPVTLVFDVPGYIAILGASSWLPTDEKQFYLSETVQERNVGDRKEITVSLNSRWVRRCRPERYVWGGIMRIYLESAPRSAGKSEVINYALMRQGEILLEKSFSITILPQLPENQPKLKRFITGTTSFASAASPVPGMAERHMQFWQSLTQVPYTWGTWRMANYTPEFLQKLNENFTIVLCAAANADETPRFKETKYGFFEGTRPKVPPLLNEKGEPVAGAICPTYLLADPEGVFWDGYFTDGIRALQKYAPGANEFVLNFEPRVEYGTCDQCRAEFARHAKLAKVPEREELRREFNAQWKLFKVDQRTRLMKKMIATVHQNLPNMRIGFCSTALQPDGSHLRDWCSIDLQQIDAEVDFFSNMLYIAGQRFYELLAHNKKALQSIQIPLIDPAERDLRWFSRYTPATVRQNFIASALLGAEGMLFYPDDYYDGRYLTMIAETAAAIAQVEDHYRHEIVSALEYEVLNSDKIQIAGQDDMLTVNVPDFSSKLKVHLHEKNGEQVISVLNYHTGAPALVKFSLPRFKGEGLFSVFDLVSQTEYGPFEAETIRAGFMAKFPPNGAAIILLGNKPTTGKIVTQSTLLNELQKEREKIAEQQSIYRGKKSENAEFRWEMWKNRLVLVMERGKSLAKIDPGAGAAITSWRNSVGKDPISYREGVIADLLFYNPPTQMQFNFEPERIAFTVRGPQVVLWHMIPSDGQAGGAGNPLEGLHVEKTITMTDDNGSLAIDWKFTNRNPSRKTMTFGSRIKNIPFRVWPTPHTPPKVRLNGAEFPRKQAEMWIRKNMPVTWPAIKDVSQCPDDSTVEVEFAEEVMVFRQPEAAGVFFWHEYAVETVEVLAPEVTLEPEKSFELKTEIKRVPKTNK